jgi:inner membrane protein
MLWGVWRPNAVAWRTLNLRECLIMASLLTHAFVGVSLGQAGKHEWRKKRSFWIVAVSCSAVADIDVLGFRMGVHYGDLWGHRGMTHSLLFAAVIAAGIAVSWRSMAGERWKLVLLLFLITASHGILDALTNGGLGVAFFSPFNPRRYFFPWRPIQVSPIGLSALFSARLMRILGSEIPWIWTPSLILAGAIWGWRAWQKARVAGV